MKPHIAHRIIRFGREILGIGAQIEGLPEPEQADRVIEALESWYRRIGTPVTFKEGGIVNTDIDALTKQALQLGNFWGIQGYSAEDVKKIYELCRRE